MNARESSRFSRLMLPRTSSSEEWPWASSHRSTSRRTTVRCPGPCSRRSRDHLDGVRAREDRLQRVRARMHAARHGEREVHAAREHRDPVEAREQLGRARKPEVRLHLERLEIDVGLVAAVEEDEPVHADLLELPRERRDRGEIREDLHRDRDRDERAHGADRVERVGLERRAARPEVRGQVVEVQLEGVRAGLLDERSRTRSSPRRSSR